jgi:putative hydrolase of HD superfamily
MMALVHDMAEAVVGDMTPECGITPADKHRIEHEAILEMCKLLPADRAHHITSLFSEYEAGETGEARLVKQVDKVEFLVQAGEYERRAAGVDLEEFFKNTRHLVKEPGLVDVLVAVEEERVASRNGNLRNGAS